MPDDTHLCLYCLDRFPARSSIWESDHVIPQCQLRDDDRWALRDDPLNLIRVCGPCNRSKCGRDPIEWWKAEFGTCRCDPAPGSTLLEDPIWAFTDGCPDRTCPAARMKWLWRSADGFLRANSVRLPVLHVNRAWFEQMRAKAWSAALADEFRVPA